MGLEALAATLGHRPRPGTSGLPTSAIDLDAARAEAANRVPGHLNEEDGVDCPECLNRGYIHEIVDGYMVTRNCQCMVQRRNLRRLRQSGLAGMVGRYTFGTWDTGEPWRRRAKELAEKYAARPAGWFIVSGPPGTGKSHLCTAICNELMERGAEVRYMLWRDVSVQAKAVVNDGVEYNRIAEPLKRVPVLYIDDLFKTGKGQAPTVGDANLAFEILNARYNDHEKATIISTERSVEDMLNIDEAVGSRIYERSKGFYLDFRGRENWRLR